MLVVGNANMNGAKMLLSQQNGYAVILRWVSSEISYLGHQKSIIDESFLAPKPQAPESWPNFLCICSVFFSGSLQLHWSYWPTIPDGPPKWFCTSKGLLGAGPSGIGCADAIITDTGSLYVAGVPVVNPSTVVIWEVSPGLGSGIQCNPKISLSEGLSSTNLSNWPGFSPLAAYLFKWQELLITEAGGVNGRAGLSCSNDGISLHCSPVSNLSAYVSPEAAAQSATTTTWGSGVTSVKFDPTRGGSALAIAIAEGQYMSPFDPDEGPTIIAFRLQLWESSVLPVVFHPLFRSSSGFVDEIPQQTVWQRKNEKVISANDDLKHHQVFATEKKSDLQCPTAFCAQKWNREYFDFRHLLINYKPLTHIVYSSYGGEIAISFYGGNTHLFSGSSLILSDSYQIDAGPAIASPVFSPTSCCLAHVWHDPSNDCTMLKIARILPPGENNHFKENTAGLERAIVQRFWWSLLVGVDWWDAVACAQSAAEDNLVSLNSVIAILDDDFHGLPTAQHKEQFGPWLDRMKCRLLEGIQAQEVRAMVLDMQARLLLDMLGKGIESSLLNASGLVSEPWQSSGETLSAIDPDSMAVDPSLMLSVHAYVDATLDLASHFITRLRRYASFCRTLANHASNAAAAATTNSRSTAATAVQNPVQGQNSTGGNGQMHAWVQSAIAKISSSSGGADGLLGPVGNAHPSTLMPISMNTGTFPGTPAVRLIGDCHFLHRLCQLLLFCFFFRRTQLPRFLGLSQRPAAAAKGGEEVTKPPPPAVKSEESKGSDNVPVGRSRLGSGNAGQGYTFDEVKVLFLIVMDLCRRTVGLAHPSPPSQVGGSNLQVRLHFIDGSCTVLPEVVEASLGPHMQNMPRPRGADAAGLLLRELELHPPGEEWHKKNMYGGPWSDPGFVTGHDHRHADDDDDGRRAPGRKRRASERDAAFGVCAFAGLGRYLGCIGSRRDVVTATWKTGMEDGIWYKCVRCLRQTSVFPSPAVADAQNDREMWWITRWVHCCPMCGGAWVRTY